MQIQNTVTIQGQVYSVVRVDGRMTGLKRYDKKSKFWVELVFSELETAVHTVLLERLEAAYFQQVLHSVEA